MNVLNSNLNILALMYFFVKNLKIRSLLYILFIINSIVLIYGLSSANIINIGSLVFVLCSITFMYFYFKKAYHQKLRSVQNLNKLNN